MARVGAAALLLLLLLVPLPALAFERRESFGEVSYADEESGLSLVYSGNTGTLTVLYRGEPIVEILLLVVEEVRLRDYSLEWINSSEWPQFRPAPLARIVEEYRWGAFEYLLAPYLDLVREATVDVRLGHLERAAARIESLLKVFQGTRVGDALEEALENLNSTPVNVTAAVTALGKAEGGLLDFASALSSAVVRPVHERAYLSGDMVGEEMVEVKYESEHALATLTLTRRGSLTFKGDFKAGEFTGSIEEALARYKHEEYEELAGRLFSSRLTMHVRFKILSERFQLAQAPQVKLGEDTYLVEMGGSFRFSGEVTMEEGPAPPLPAEQLSPALLALLLLGGLALGGWLYLRRRARRYFRVPYEEAEEEEAGEEEEKGEEILLTPEGEVEEIPEEEEEEA